MIIQNLTKKGLTKNDNHEWQTNVKSHEWMTGDDDGDSKMALNLWFLSFMNDYVKWNIKWREIMKKT